MAHSSIVASLRLLATVAKKLLTVPPLKPPLANNFAEVDDKKMIETFVGVLDHTFAERYAEDLKLGDGEVVGRIAKMPKLDGTMVRNLLEGRIGGGSDLTRFRIKSLMPQAYRPGCGRFPDLEATRSCFANWSWLIDSLRDQEHQQDSSETPFFCDFFDECIYLLEQKGNDDFFLKEKQENPYLWISVIEAAELVLDELIAFASADENVKAVIKGRPIPRGNFERVKDKCLGFRARLTLVMNREIWVFEAPDAKKVENWTGPTAMNVD